MTASTKPTNRKKPMYGDKCPDGATDEEHDTMLDQIGYCPWCGQEED